MNDTREKLLQSLGTLLLKDLDEAGLTRKKLIEKLGEELEATEVKPFNHNGTIIYSKPLPNWEIRQKARLDIQKLCAFYPPEKYQLQLPPLSNMSDEELDEKIKALLDKERKDEPKAINYQGPQDGEIEETHE
jgi:hypothetical protein